MPELRDQLFEKLIKLSAPEILIRIRAARMSQASDRIISILKHAYIMKTTDDLLAALGAAKV